jgi:hypothetical protein
MQKMRGSLVGKLLLSACGLAALTCLIMCVFVPGWPCGTDVEATRIENSAIVFVTKIQRCSAIDGTISIASKNIVTGKTEEVVFIPGEVISVIRAIGSHTVEIQIPNRVETRRQIDYSQGVKIVYRYVPKDDPTDRKAYQFYAEHPDDPRAARWAAKNLFEQKYTHLPKTQPKHH